MTFDDGACIGILGQPLRLTLQHGLVFGINIETVGFKQDAVAECANLLQEIFLTARYDLAGTGIGISRVLAIISALCGRGQSLNLFLAAACDKRGRYQ